MSSSMVAAGPGGGTADADHGAVEPAEALEGGGHQAVGDLGVGQVAGDRPTTRSGAAQGLRGGDGTGLLPGAEHHARALGHQLCRGGVTRGPARPH